MSVLRLAPNVSAPVTTLTATAAPTMADRIGAPS